MQNNSVFWDAAERADSFYVYFEEIIKNHVRELKSAFKGVDFLYSFKTNPHPRIVKSIVEEGFGADAASPGEVFLAAKSGLSREQIYYSAPGKKISDISGALGKCVIIADSISEIERISELAASAGLCESIGVRINPDFTFYSDTGECSKFGIDEELLFAEADRIKKLPGIKITGIHVHSRSQELNADVLKKYYDNVLALAQKTEKIFGSPLEFINLGGGLGIPYAAGDLPLDTERLGSAVAGGVALLKAQNPGLKIFAETGRFAVGKSGFYCAKVVDIKTSRGKKYIILSATLNGFIRPSIEQLITSYQKENPKPCEPLFTKPGAFEFIALSRKGTEETEKVTLAGNLCTAADVMATDIILPKLSVGDMVAVSNAGSYAAVLTPFRFSSHAKTEEFFLDINQKLSCRL